MTKIKASIFLPILFALLTCEPIEALGVERAKAPKARRYKKKGPRKIKSVRRLLRYLKRKRKKNPDMAAQPPTIPSMPGGPVFGPEILDQAAGAPINAESGGGQGQPGTGMTFGFSTTNVQVEGVDEGDIVKTDGEFLYQVNRERVLVIKAHPFEALAVAGMIEFESDFVPQEVFLRQGALVVLGCAYRSTPVPEPPPDGAPATEIGAPGMMAPDHFYFPLVKAFVFDVTDKTAIKQVREVVIDGYLLASRMIGDVVYLIAQKDVYFPFKEIRKKGLAEPADPDWLMPTYLDDSQGDDTQPVAIHDLAWFPDLKHLSYLVVAGLNVSDASTPMQVRAYLGAGQVVYASQENLYITSGLMRGPTEAFRSYTLIRKFSLDEGSSAFVAAAEVPGWALNQFSMDEYDRHFRIATTTSQWDPQDGPLPLNHLFVLDSEMNPVGELRDLAPNESIFSARFIRDRCYLVTFRQIDPLFVIGLADPSSPQVLGELKITGFSTYLHPFDENHILGFGMEVDPDLNGWSQGMKVALFDVSDVENPTEKATIHIGDQGTYSELLHDHRALLFDREKNLLAFPVEVVERTPTQDDWWNFKNVFTGAHVYHVDPDSGFRLKGAISHSPGGQPAPDWGVDHWRHRIRRILYIGEDLYTLSEAQVRVNDMETVEEKNVLDLP